MLYVCSPEVEGKQILLKFFIAVTSGAEHHTTFKNFSI